MTTESDEKRAAELAELAETDPESVPLDELDALLESDDDAVLQRVLETLAVLGRDAPERLAQRQELIVECLDGNAVETRVLATRVLGRIAVTCPDNREAVLDDLVDLLAAETARVDEMTILTPDDEVPKDAFAVLPPLLNVLKAIEDAYPGSTIRTIEHLETLLDTRSDSVQLTTLELLGMISVEEPSAIRAVAPALRNYVERGPNRESIDDEEFSAFLGRSESVSWSDIHAAATVALCNLSREHPDEARPVVDELARLLDTSDQGLRYAVVVGLRSVARTSPEQVQPVVDSVAERLDDSEAFVRAQAADTLAIVGQSCPDDVVPYVDNLRPLLEDSTESVRNGAMRALTVLAIHEPAAVRPAVPTIASLATDDDATIRKDAVSCLWRVAEAYPDAVRPFRSAVEARLDDESAGVRRAAAKAALPVGVERARWLARRLGEKDFGD